MDERQALALAQAEWEYNEQFGGLQSKPASVGIERPSLGQAAQQVGKSALRGFGNLFGLVADYNPFNPRAFVGGPKATPIINSLIDRIPDTAQGPVVDFADAAMQAAVIPMGGPVVNAISGIGGEAAAKMFPESKAAPILGALFAGPGAAAAGGKVVRGARSAGKAFERASVGAGTRAYLKSAKKTGLIEEAETGAEITKLNKAISDIGDRDGWGVMRDPDRLLARVNKQMDEAGSRIGAMAAAADDAAISPSLRFSNAEKVIESATASKPALKKAFDEFMEAFTDPKDGWDRTVSGLQKWSKDIRNLGFSGQATGQMPSNVARSLQRAIGKDMQDAIKGTMQKAGYSSDEIAAAFKKYGDYAEVLPVVTESVVKGEADTLASIMRVLLRTSGGTLTTPTLLAGALGGAGAGPLGLAAGLGLGALGSPTGAGAAGRGLNVLSNLGKRGLAGATPATSLPASLFASANALKEVEGSANGVTNRGKAQEKQEQKPSKNNAANNSNNPFHSFKSTPKVNGLQIKSGGNDDRMAAISSSNDSKKNSYDDLAKRIMPKVWMAESSNNPKAINKKSGAMGLGQMMPATWREWAPKVLPGIKADPFNKTHNAKVSSAYMSWLLKQFDGDIPLALAAYNYGIGNVRKLLKGDATGINDIYAKLPKETQKYVRRILVDEATSSKQTS